LSCLWRRKRSRHISMVSWWSNHIFRSKLRKDAGWISYDNCAVFVAGII
jgi:hypothetical protein